ncbi:MAG: STAS domain-containing protein [Sedimentisphaerales bacterium]|nr:STAS domain-containing protein [Sedimentisphaerales bacterium]
MINTDRENGKATVQPAGKITAGNADNLRRELLELVESGVHTLTIDLNNVDIIDSKGLSVFIVCHKTLSEKGGSLSVITENKDFQQLFHVMRLDEHFKVSSGE